MDTNEQSNETDSRARLPELSYSGPYKKALDICSFYGITLITAPEITKDTKAYTEKFKENKKKLSDKEPELTLDERAAMVLEYSEKDWHTLPQPVLVVYTKKVSPRGERFLYLHALGVTKSVADMLSIHLAWTILTETVKKEKMLHINSMGDKESSANFVRELSNYFRKHINSLPDDCRESFKGNILNILKENRPECRGFQEDAPRSINFLSEPSRKYFKDVIEFIEAQSIPYTIDSSLVDSKDAYTETIFSIREKENGDKSKVLAVGARSNNLTRGVGMRKTVPIMSSVIHIPGTTGRENIKADKIKKKKPQIFFIQLGDEARLHSFALLERLRKAKLPVEISFGKEKMSTQIAQAERLKVPITLIVGQKEALEHSVIIRDMRSLSQIIVDINNVEKEIKKLLS